MPTTITQIVLRTSGNGYAVTVQGPKGARESLYVPPAGKDPTGEVAEVTAALQFAIAEHGKHVA